MRRRRARRAAAGFTLLEVVVALAILAISLTMLLVTNASNIDNASRARDLTIASLLARSKMIDIEQKLVDEGFTAGTVDEEGTFEDEGRPEINWVSKVTEVELTLDNLSSLCAGFMDSVDVEVGDAGAAGGCDEMLGSLGGPLDAMVADIGASVRMIELTVTWPVGHKYTESMSVAGLVTRHDWALEEANDVNRAVQEATGVLPGQTPGWTPGQ